MATLRHISIKKWAEEDRPREKLLLQGRSNLSEAELLAILLGSGSRKESALDLSKRILSMGDNRLSNLSRMNVQELKRFHGVGEAKAITIVAALELGRRRLEEQALERLTVRSSRQVYDYFYSRMVDLPHEELWMLLLNRGNKVLSKSLISQGGLDGTVADIRLIFKAAVEHLATGLILCHNHPSGVAEPSRHDRALTEKVVAAGKVMSIPLLDHVIVADGSYYSFADQGIL